MNKGFSASLWRRAQGFRAAIPGLVARSAAPADPLRGAPTAHQPNTHQPNKGVTMRGRGVLLAALIAASMSLGLPATGQAQDAGSQSAGDPPSRVGRVAEMSGTVSFHTADETQWQAATLNYPVTSGNSFWTEPRSHAAVDVGPSRIYLDSSTELDIGTLNDQGFVASLPQGAVYVRVSDAAGATPFEIDTPRGQVHISQPGHYEVVAGDADHPTLVTAYDGGAQVTGQGVNLSLGPQQAAAISGQNVNDLQVATGQAQQPDDFVQFVQNEEQPYQNQPAQAQQYVSPGMTGYQDLNQYGAWQSTPDYGQVWYPQVSAGWAPYRYGHWAYVAPWGWTWVDDAPWGFAPFHYGRWVDYDGRWGWAPGAYEQDPVYAPALVSFFGDLGGIGVGVSIGFGDVGWVPLGWGEPYYPGYGVSEHCFRQLNVAYINNTTIINNYYNDYRSGHHDEFDHYRNHDHGWTMVSADDMQHSRSVGQAWRKHPQDGSNPQWTHAKSWGGQAPVKPSFATAGLTPNSARQLGLKGQPGSFQQHRSPGPSFAGGQFGNSRNVAGNGQPANGFAAGSQTQNQGQLFANSRGNSKLTQKLLTPNGGQTQGQFFANAPAGQPPFGQTQKKKTQTGMGQNNGLVGHYTQTPPLLGTTGHGTNVTGNWQNNAGGTNQARNFFQPQGQTTNGSRNLSNNAGGTNQARNYFQQPAKTTNGSRNLFSNAGNTNQARNYFQQPAKTTNGSRNLFSNAGNTSQPRNYFQQPTQRTNQTFGQGNGYFQQPTKRANQTFSQGNGYFQQPTQRTNQSFGQGNGIFKQPQQPQRNFVSNNFQGQGGNAFSRQQVQQPRNTQPQAPTVFKKKTNNGG